MTHTHVAPGPNRRAGWQVDAALDDLRWALRVVSGASLGAWGLAALHGAGSWFAYVIATALVASGAMLTTKKLALPALVVLLPVSVHLLLSYVLFNG
jgi:hypothetical protein